MTIKIQAIVLAAGKSTRFQTGKTKLTTTLCGQPMILYATRLLEQLSIPTTIVVGYQKEIVANTITEQHGDTISFVQQTEQLGTGHAVLCTQDEWNAQNILIINGDAPLITPQVINDLIAKHTQTDAAISFVTAHNSDERSKGYGRVIEKDNAIEIIEAKHFTGQMHEQCFVNAGIYLVKKSFLLDYAQQLQQNELSNEFYITDLVKIASQQKLTVTTTTAPFDIIRGINTLEELWAAEHIKRTELIRHWKKNGVYFSTPQNALIDLNVHIGSGTFIGAGVHLLGNTRVGSQCTIEAFTIIQNATIGDGVKVRSHSVITDSSVHEHAEIGPFAHIQSQTTIHHNAAIGNFVEVKRSTIGAHTKAKHLTYLGDATVGNNVNIGAGTITCNYDGKEKHATTIKDNAFIGTNNSLIAPVTIEHNAYTAAGSTITKNVPADSLAIARSRQINKEGYRDPQRKKSNDNNGISFMGAIKTENDSPTLE